MINQTVLTSTKDDKGYPEAQVVHNGKATNTLRAIPYGLCTRPPNRELCITFNANGNADAAYSLPLSTINRLKDLAVGEVALFNSETGAYVKLKADGAVEVVTGTSQFSISANGSAELTVPSGLTVTGDVNVTGDVVATGTVTGTVDVIAGITIPKPLGVSGALHVHGGVTTGGGSTLPPT